MTTETRIVDGVDLVATQKRTVRVLFAATVVSRAAMTLAFTVAALAIKDMLSNDAFAGFGTAMITAGTALGAFILSSMMTRSGRNIGLRRGYAVAAVGAVLAGVAVESSSLTLFLIGMAAFGFGQGATNLARYAAADLAEPDDRAGAISTVVFASTIGAVGGPLLVGPMGAASEATFSSELSGPFFGSAICFVIAGLVIWLLLRPDPLILAGGLDSQQETKPDKLGFGPAINIAWSSPMARLAMFGLVISQAVMVAVMTMTPLHMDAHGHSTAGIGAVISAHTFGMFAFAPLGGWATRRVGATITIGVGAAILAVATILTALAGEAPRLLMFPGLYLLGLGWSLAMVAGSALLTSSVEADVRVGVQGSVEVLTSLASGVGAIASGFVFDMAGFHILSMVSAIVAGLLMIGAVTRYRLDVGVLRPV